MDTFWRTFTEDLLHFSLRAAGGLSPVLLRLHRSAGVRLRRVGVRLRGVGHQQGLRRRCGHHAATGGALVLVRVKRGQRGGAVGSRAGPPDDGFELADPRQHVVPGNAAVSPLRPLAASPGSLEQRGQAADAAVGAAAGGDGPLDVMHGPVEAGERGRAPPHRWGDATARGALLFLAAAAPCVDVLTAVGLRLSDGIVPAVPTVATRRQQLGLELRGQDLRYAGFGSR